MQIIKDRLKLIKALTGASNSIFVPQINNFDSVETVRVRVLWRGIVRHIRRNTVDMLSYSVDNPRLVSYAAKIENRFNPNQRVKTTLGKYLRRRLKIDCGIFSDSILASITDCVFGAISDPVADITIVDGDEIKTAYEEQVGGSSCMTGQDANKVSIYANNPQKVAMLIYNNGITARALAFETDCGKIVIDRIYPNSGAHVDAIHNWAVDNGYIYRSRNSLPDSDVELSDGKFYKVTLKNTNNTFPYFDTWHYGEEVGENIVLSNEEEFGDMRLDSTSGGYSDSDGIICIHCEEQVNEDYIRCNENGTPYCEDCYHEFYSMCECCEEEVSSDDVCTVKTRYNGHTHTEYWCEYCRDHKATYCDGCSEYFDENFDMIEAKDTCNVYCPDCCCDNLTCCEDCEEYFEQTEETETDDGTEELCEQCRRNSIVDRETFQSKTTETKNKATA